MHQTEISCCGFSARDPPFARQALLNNSCVVLICEGEVGGQQEGAAARVWVLSADSPLRFHHGFVLEPFALQVLGLEGGLREGHPDETGGKSGCGALSQRPRLALFERTSGFRKTRATSAERSSVAP